MQDDSTISASPSRDDHASFSAIIVGAGFAGLYLLHRLREQGLRTRVFEAADNVGGTWYWNRYPGARCDAESLAYSFSFSKELEQEWQWSERYATQPEILRYMEHVAERFDLRRDIRFSRRVTAAHYDEASMSWTVKTDAGDIAHAPICIMATGCLSVPQRPAIPGLDTFAGRLLQASDWPREPVSFSGERVGLIGTGSSGIQAVPVIAEEAGHLHVFQRTPNYSVPACNAPLDPEWVAEFKQHYQAHRRLHRTGQGSGFGDLEIEPRPQGPAAESGVDLSAAEIHEILAQYWNHGGARFIGAVGDTLMHHETNAVVAEFVRAKIRGTVRDPATAAALCPTDHPIGTKRICVDSGYFEAYNRDHVTLVDLRRTPIEAVTAAGVRTSEAEYPLDTLILATGFDAMTGALLRMDVRGESGRSLADKWRAGPVTYLGLLTAGFPNLFMVTGPGSPSVLSNMLVSIEQHVDWITDCLAYMRSHAWRRIDADPAAETDWVAHVNEVADATLFPEGGSWYLGANVPGKPRVFMPYAGGVGPYREICDRVVDRGYEGFRFGS